MGTRSMIGIKGKNGNVTQAIYCHWDGYPSHQLPILEQHYTDVKTIRKLMNLGNISVLAPKLKPVKDLQHSFECKGRQEDVVLAYHRDRGDDFAKMFCTQKTFLGACSIASDWDCSYMYLFDVNTNSWNVTEIY